MRRLPLFLVGLLASAAALAQSAPSYLSNPSTGAAFNGSLTGNLHVTGTSALDGNATLGTNGGGNSHVFWGTVTSWNGIDVRSGSSLRLIDAAGALAISIFNDGTNIDAGASSTSPLKAFSYKIGSGSTVINSSGVLQAVAFPALTGDVTTSAGALVTTIAPNATTFAKFQQVAASSIVGNPTGSLANAQGITLSPDLAFSAGALQVGAFTGDITKSAGSLATAIGANAVTFAKMQALSAGGKLLGSAVGSTAVAEITVGTGLTIGTSTLRLANISATTLLGNSTGGATTPGEITLAGGLAFSGTTLTAAGPLTPTSIASTGTVTTSAATSGIGYATGAGGTATQATSRTTGVTINKSCGAVTLVSAAGSATWNTFPVTDSAVGATDVVILSEKSGTDKYNMFTSAVGAGSFNISFSDVTGTTTEQPVINFCDIKGVAA